MKYLILAVFLAGCASNQYKLPVHDPEKRLIEVVVIMHPSRDSIQLSHPYMVRVDGFKRIINGKCEVHYVQANYDALAHEMAHCFYGGFHE